MNSLHSDAETLLRKFEDIPTLCGTLYIICGMAGAGKTTLAKKLAESSKAVRFCPDEWITALVDDVHDRTKVDPLRDPVEKLQWDISRRLLLLGTNVILENGFWSRKERLEYLITAQDIGAKVILHFLEVPKQELIRRVELRNANLPHGSFHVFPAEIETWLSCFEAPEEAELALYDGYELHR